MPGDNGHAGQMVWRRETPRHGSVTERLSARLDDLEPVVASLLKNEAKLIADSLTLTARLLRAEQWAGERWNECHAVSARGFWGRLRWLVTGR